MAYFEVGLCKGRWLSNPHCLVHAQYSSLIPFKKETLTDVLYYSLSEDWALVKVILSKFMLLFKWLDIEALEFDSDSNPVPAT